jgi:hypothetical protein
MDTTNIDERRAVEKTRERSIARMAWKIHRNSDMPQDIRILCPVSADGYYCEWVAGHYGGHNINRAYKQRNYV